MRDPERDERDSSNPNAANQGNSGNNVGSTQNDALQLHSHQESAHHHGYSDRSESTHQFANIGEVAQEQLAHLVRTEAPQGQIRSIATIAYELKTTVDKTIAARKQAGKERLPAIVYTTEECKQLKEYRASHNLIKPYLE